MSEDVCIVCGKSDDLHELGAWFVGTTRSLIHVDCWVAEYKPHTPARPSPQRPTA